MQRIATTGHSRVKCNQAIYYAERDARSGRMHLAGFDQYEMGCFLWLSCLLVELGLERGREKVTSQGLSTINSLMSVASLLSGTGTGRYGIVHT